jgi:hypothetical protein
VKKIVIVFKGRFKEEEVASLSTEAIRAVRGAFGSQIPGSHPSVIVHCDFKSEPTSLIVCHAYGFDLDEGPKVEEIAIEIVGSVWHGGRWRSSDRQEDATCEEG